MNDNRNQAGQFQLRRSRVVMVYVACFIGAALAPADSYFSDGVIATSEIIISLLAFVTGIAVATFAMWQFRRKGRFLHYELKD